MREYVDVDIIENGRVIGTQKILKVDTEGKTTEDENLDYWNAKKTQHQRALDFLAEARPGDTYRIERYAIPVTGIPHALSVYADRHEKRIVTVYAKATGSGAYWFTTTTGEAIDADTLIKWERVPKQGELF